MRIAIQGLWIIPRHTLRLQRGIPRVEQSWTQISEFIPLRTNAALQAVSLFKLERIRIPLHVIKDSGSLIILQSLIELTKTWHVK